MREKEKQKRAQRRGCVEAPAENIHLQFRSKVLRLAIRCSPTGQREIIAVNYHGCVWSTTNYVNYAWRDWIVRYGVRLWCYKSEFMNGTKTREKADDGKD